MKRDKNGTKAFHSVTWRDMPHPLDKTQFYGAGFTPIML
jgi:hypothetical protein